MAATLNGTGVTFSDGSNQNSANAFNTIGVPQLFWYTGTTSVAAGSTVSGSYLFYATAVADAYSATSGASPGQSFYVATSAAGGNRTTPFSFNGSTLSPVGSGTWRVMTRAVQFGSACGYGNFSAVMAIRVS